MKLKLDQESMVEVLQDVPYHDGRYFERGSDMWMEANQSSSRLFEKSKISALRDERETVQKKTFTKWVNSHLQKVNAHINELYHDLQDGRQLILLLEILSGQKLPRPSKGRMRIHFLENVEHGLVFLKKKDVPLTNVGNHDIVDGNPKITLGLVWTIILRFQIQDIMIESDSTEQRSAKDALLLWCQSKTQGYKNVNISNFTTSWRDGLAFNAIIHKHRPDLVDMDRLVKEEPITNLNVAFDTAEQHLGVFPLLDAPDVCVDYPDEKSIMTYVATYYQYFSKMKQVEVSGSRIQNVVKQALDNEKLVKEYEVLSSALMEWIQTQIVKLKDRTLGNSLQSVQKQLTVFNLYRTQEKPPKYVEKGNLEVQMFEITSQLRLNHQKMYYPSEGLMIGDINAAWSELEKAENEKEVILREELIHQQQLEQLASKFMRKANLRSSWLKDNCKLLKTDNFGEDLFAVEASLKKHATIETDVKAYEARIVSLQNLADELCKQNYHQTPHIESWIVTIKELWTELMHLLTQRSSRLNRHLQLHKLFQEMIYVLEWMEDLMTGLVSSDYGKHLADVKDLLHKHDLIESDINTQCDKVKRLVESSDVFLQSPTSQDDGYMVDKETVKENQSEVTVKYEELQKMSSERKQHLVDSLEMHTFYQNLEEEDIWLSEKEYVVSSTEYGHDLYTTTLLLLQHKSLEQELVAKKLETEELLQKNPSKDDFKENIGEQIDKLSDTLKSKWDSVMSVSEHRRKKLEEKINFHQYLIDCNEIDADMKELEAPLSSDDLGNDEQSVEELLRNCEKLEGEVKALGVALDSLVEEKNLGDLNDKDLDEVKAIESSVKSRYDLLTAKCSERKSKLLKQLELFQMYSEADLIRSWINEKNSQLSTYLIVDRSFDLERCRTIQHQFETLEKELNTHSQKMDSVNNIQKKFHDEPEFSQLVADRVKELTTSWDNLQLKANEKKKELSACVQIQELYSEITETQGVISEKSGLLATLDDSGSDLSSLIALQRHLHTIEYDIANLPSLMQNLHARAVELSRAYPEEAVNIQARFDHMQTLWEKLSKSVKEKNDSLAEKGELKRFIISFDDFLAWLNKTSEKCSSEDIPQSLMEVESMLDDHSEVKSVIQLHADEYNQIISDGQKFINENDCQMQSLSQQLKDLTADWNELHTLWEKRNKFLEQCMNYQLYLRDSKQCEAILRQQELYLSKQQTHPTTDSVQEAITNLAEFIKKMDSQDEKMNHIVSFAEQLCSKQHYAADRVKEKSKNIDDRRVLNRNQANDLQMKLLQELKLKQFIDDSNEVIDWMDERSQSIADDSYKDLTNVRSKLAGHAVFEAELNANKIKIDVLRESGEDIISSNPESRPEVEERLEKIDSKWTELNLKSKEKKDCLSEANRQQDFNKELENLDTWVNEMHNQINDDEPCDDIVTARNQHSKHKQIETMIASKKQRMVELSVNPDKVDEEVVVAERVIMEERFMPLEQPLADKREKINESLSFYQYKRDVDDTLLWIEEKEPLLLTENFGETLSEVLQAKKRHSVLCMEIVSYETIVGELLNRGCTMVNESHPKSEQVQDLHDQLEDKWNKLKDTSDIFQETLDKSLQAKQYLFDAYEAESWMSERELFLLADERVKDVEQVEKMLKKHLGTRNAVEGYEVVISNLNNVVQELSKNNHPDSSQLLRTQDGLLQLYDRLKELADEKQEKLDENLKLFQFHCDVQDLKSWIMDKELVACSQDIGEDFDHTQMLIERFLRFTRDTKAIGGKRVTDVNALADQLIGTGHTDSLLISEWKEMLNECWENFLELLKTRKELLDAGYKYHCFFHEAKETLNMIEEKEKHLTDDLGRDQQSVYTLQRYHKAYEVDLQPLSVQVENIKQVAGALKELYAGDEQTVLSNKEEEVVQAWRELMAKVEQRAANLQHSDEYQRYLMSVEDLMQWLEDMRMQIQSDESPIDISTCEHLMGDHQTRKSEMDTKEPKFAQVSEDAQKLLAKKHYASIDIQEKLDGLQANKESLLNEWSMHWEELQLILEVMQFAREAHLADEWVAQNHHFIQGKDAGSYDEVMRLIEKHTNFERLLNKQSDRFETLEKLTTFELRNARQKQLDKAKKEKEEKEKRENERNLAAILESNVAREELTKAKESASLVEVETPVAAVNVPLSPILSEDETPKIEGPTAKMSGSVTLKATKESPQTKKSPHKSWKDFFAVLKDDCELRLYTDEKSETEVSSIALVNCQVEVASNYHKRKHTLRLKVANGAEYLIHTASADVMSLWIQNIRQSALETSEEMTSVVAAQSLSKKEKRKSGSLFSKKKKAPK